MKDKFHLLNQGFEGKSDDKIAITSRNKKEWIRVIPLDKQPKPHIYLWLNRRSDNLLELLKETDFHTGFTKRFKTIADRSIFNADFFLVYSD